MRLIVLSLQPRWAELIRAGEKTIELRRRFPPDLQGAVAYIYVSSPTRSLTSAIQIGAVHKLELDELWRSHGKASCVDERHFTSYFQDRKVGFGIEVVRHVALPRRWDLRDLREEFNFTAPQSWGYASPKLVDAIGVPL